jgi:DNA-binding NarL/FixJ family response regulator
MGKKYNMLRGSNPNASRTIFAGINPKVDDIGLDRFTAADRANMLRNEPTETVWSAMTDHRTRRAHDLILAAAMRPEGWKDVLHCLAEATDCVAAGITIEDARTRKGEPLVYFGFDTDHVRRTFDYYLPMNPLFGIAERMRPGFVVTNGDVIRESAFRRTEFYDGWARPQGICCPTTVVLNRKGERYIPLTLVRPDRKGDVSRSDLRWLGELVPHLVRAMEITVEMDARSLDYHVIEDAVEGSNLGVIALDDEGRIVYANRVAERRLNRDLGIRQRQGRLSGVTASIDGQLKQAVDRARASGTFGRDIRIEAEGRPPLVVKVIPMGSDHGFAKIDSRRAAVLLIFRDAPIGVDQRLQYIAEAYRLTSAECRVLAAVVNGADMKSIASQLCISMATLKTHLVRIFSKTNTSRQKALVSLVLRDTDSSPR